MKQSKSLVLYCLFLTLSATSTHAQYFFGEYIYRTAIIRSDIPSKSVLVSNLLADSVGDLSPVICAANWTENGRQLECRSLLKFNYDYIPKFIFDDPSLLVSAELILYPLQLAFSQNDANKPAKFVVRRVAEDWEDSVTTWMHQPQADSSLQANKLVKVKNKSDLVRVDVTKLVLKMLRKGNNGFQISTENPGQESLASGQFFASPKYGFEELRPLLVINYRRLYNPSTVYGSWYDARTEESIHNFRSMQPIGNSYPVMEPVREPVIVHEPLPAPTPPPKNPVKD